MGKHELTEEERGWCIALREALEQAGVAVPRPDFRLAQSAIIAKGKVRKGVERVKKFNSVVLGKYGYSAASARKTEAAGLFEREFPGAWVSCEHPSLRHPMVAGAAVGYKPSQIRDRMDLAMVDLLLMLDAFNADLDDVRAGSVFVMDLKGCGMQNYDHAMECAPRGAVPRRGG